MRSRHFRRPADRAQHDADAPVHPGAQEFAMATIEKSKRAHARSAAAADSTCAAAAKTVTLALQGGGAHGAFTWGVLDRLLEDDRIGFEGVSATSAGAMNATVLAFGMAV